MNIHMHKFVDLCMYTCVCSVSTLPHWSFCRSSYLFKFLENTIMVQVSNALFGSFMSYGCHLWHQKCHCYWSHCNHTYICYDIMPSSALHQLFTSHNGSSQQCSFGSFMCYWCHCYWNLCNHTRLLPHHTLQLIAPIVHLSFWI